MLDEGRQREQLVLGTFRKYTKCPEYARNIDGVPHGVGGGILNVFLTQTFFWPLITHAFREIVWLLLTLLEAPSVSFCTPPTPLGVCLLHASAGLTREEGGAPPFYSGVLALNKRRKSIQQFLFLTNIEMAFDMFGLRRKVRCAKHPSTRDELNS